MQKDLSQFISTAHAHGMSKEHVYLQLLQQGHTLQEIEVGYALSQGPTESPSATEVDLVKSQPTDALQNKVVQIVLVVGALLIGAGVFSLIASNWQGMSSAVKMLILLASLASAHLGGWYAADVKGYEKTGSALLFLATLIFGGSLFLTGQIFHIRANWPDGFILWMLGALSLGIVRQSLVQCALALFVGFIAVFGTPFALFFEIGSFNPFLFSSTALIGFAAVSAGVAAWYMRTTMLRQIEEAHD